MPEVISFNTIQEIGVRSLSEYVLVFYLDASEMFRWTALVRNRYEVNSSISFIIVDSGTTAILTADRIHSTQQCTEDLFELGEQEKAKKNIFSEQAHLLGKKLERLFHGK